MAEEGERPPPFLRHGAFATLVFVVAVTVLLATSDLDLGGPPLVGFAVGFVVFVKTYFLSMWIGWLFLRGATRSGIGEDTAESAEGRRH